MFNLMTCFFPYSITIWCSPLKINNLQEHSDVQENTDSSSCKDYAGVKTRKGLFPLVTKNSKHEICRRTAIVLRVFPMHAKHIPYVTNKNVSIN